jgi:hypothetical protein
MNAVVTVKVVANADGLQWVVFATLDLAWPRIDRHHFAISTCSEHEALRVASDLLAATALRAGTNVRSNSSCNVANDE